MPNLSPKVICFKILAVWEMDSILDFKSDSLMCRVKGMPEIQTKRFLWVAFHRFPLSIDKITRPLPIFIDFVFYPLVTPGSNYARNWGYFERTADLNREKLGKIKNLADIGNPRKALKPVLKKSKVFWKKVIINCLILRLSIATQLSTNSLFTWNQRVFNFGWTKEQIYLPIKIDGIGKI